MNLIHIAGHLGNDPETRFTSGGQKVISFRLAARARKGGQDQTIWYRITIWGDRFDRLLPHLKKGSSVIVIGEMQKPEIYNSRDGQPQVSIDVTAEVIRFSPFGRTDRPGGEERQVASPELQPAAMAGVGMGGGDDMMDDDLPF